MKITIMGLGLHGGGLASARFFLERGAEVTITDLRDETTLKPSMLKLAGFPVRYVLGRHDTDDFTGADMVIKNPAVPLTSPYLKAAERIESDISIFLRHNRRPLIVVTGTKGKSTVVSAIYHGALKAWPKARLGGNITVSPLTFIDECTGESGEPVILELSSWQLADLAGKKLLKPSISMITNIMHDHQNRYNTFRDYVNDKKLIYADQGPEDIMIINGDDPWSDEFIRETAARPFPFTAHPAEGSMEPGSWLDDSGRGFIRTARTPEAEEILPVRLKVQGLHNRINLLAAAAALRLYGMESSDIAEALAGFGGIPHRLELVAEKKGVRWFNDSASTIPESTEAAVASFSEAVQLICGGTDKELDFAPFRKCAPIPGNIFLLEGSATDKMIVILKEEHIPFHGPFGSLQSAVEAAAASAREGDVVVFSPGATSFGMFLNEFDRGDQFRNMVSER
jgi:UDP-N-acetylmuramoylalanine--D-glutamate ligase